MYENDGTRILFCRVMNTFYCIVQLKLFMHNDQPFIEKNKEIGKIHNQSLKKPVFGIIDKIKEYTFYKTENSRL